MPTINTAGANTPQIQFPNTAPPTVGAQIGGGSLDQGVDPNYRDPQSNQWNVTVEREISNNTSVRASYVGMHTLQAEHYGGPESDSRKHDAFHDHGRESICRSSVSLHELDGAFQHVQCG